MHTYSPHDQVRGSNKLAVPEEHWDAMFAPSSMLSIITTVDGAGNVNAAASGTCIRVCHDPMLVAFTVDADPASDTCSNILSTGEFVINGVPFDPVMLKAIRVVGLPFPTGVDELERAGLNSQYVDDVLPPLIAESRVHFACTVKWTKEFEHRIMVCGRVSAVFIDADGYDPRGLIRWEVIQPAHYCGAPYGGAFVAVNQPTYIPRGDAGNGPWRDGATVADDVDVLGDASITVEFGGEARRRA